jgi:glutathione S-transferase
MKTDGSEEHLEPWFIELNPNAVVPVLDHDGNIIIESCVILEYLEDVFPEIRLRPDDPVARARMRYWLDRSESVLHRNINLLSHNRFMARFFGHMSLDEKLAIAAKQPRISTRTERERRYRNGVSADEERLAEAVIAECLDDMQNELNARPWLAGDEYSLADIAIVPFFERFEANGLKNLLDWNRRPAVGDWWQRIRERPAYQQGMALDKGPG